jgi:hypothetical protein
MLVRAPRVALAATVLVLTAAAASPVAQAGVVTTRTTVSTKTVKTGVVFSHFRITVKGVWGVQDVYQLSWLIGNPHVRLHSSLLGSYNPANQWIVDHPISHLGVAGGPRGMIAAMTADYSSYKSQSPTQSRVSGLLVQHHNVYRFDSGSPAVGYTPAGGFVIGTPAVRPELIALPGGATATVGAWNPSAATLADVRGDQVGVYTTVGTVVTVPAGYVALELQSAALRQALRGRQAFTNTHGINTREWVAGFRITDPAAASQVADMPVVKTKACPTGVCAAGASVTVPRTGVVVIARESHPAAVGLETVAAEPAPAVPVTISDAGWDQVGDITGGKPQLVRNGVPVTSRPAFVDPWQWDCGGGCWRPALVRSTTGRGWLIVIGRQGGGGMTMPQFAGVLQNLGASQALGFDNNNSAELWRPGHTPITGYGYERLLPTATSLSYN